MSGAGDASRGRVRDDEDVVPDDEGGSERGEATIEFIGMTLLLLVPLIYVVVALAGVQGAIFAAEAASREAVRVLAADPAATSVARIQATLAFEDHGLGEPLVEISCVPDACTQPGSQVMVRVSTVVPLPLVPGWVGQRGLLPVSSTSTALVEGVRLRG